MVAFSEARNNFIGLMDRVVVDCDHTVITRQGGEPVVMLSLSQWYSIQETAHLLSSPKNAARLASAIAQLDAGKGRRSITRSWRSWLREGNLRPKGGLISSTG